jgi:predicted nucleic acid-binding protein
MLGVQMRCPTISSSDSFRNGCAFGSKRTLLLSFKQRFQTSYWDAAILAAAKAARCELLLSEDLNPGQDYDGVVVVNPFLAA